MTVQVVGAGLGRTGTTSLKQALELLLGAPSYHMGEVQEHPEHPDLWAAAYGGALPDWDRMLDGYAATLDWPAAPFWPQLAQTYPTALILLSVRDADSWWRSASNTIFPAMASAYFTPDAPDDGWTGMCVGMMTTFTPHWQDERAAKAAFLAHNDHVRQTAPSDRLLEWQAGDGWGPLCERLGVREPAVPFPHVNTEAETRAQLARPASDVH